MKRPTVSLLSISIVFINWDPSHAFINRSFQLSGVGSSTKILPLKSTRDDNISADNFSVVIGKGSALNLQGDGILTFSDSLLVEGTLIGNLKCLRDENSLENTFVKIGAEGELYSDVKCVSAVEVLGKLTGDIDCQQLNIGPGAQVIGNIRAGSM